MGKRMGRLALILLAALAFSGLWGGPPLIAQGSNPFGSVAQSGATRPDMVKLALYTLKDQYVEKIDYNALLKSAGKAVQYYLKQHKIDFTPIDHYPTSVSADANLATLEKDLDQILTTYKGKVNEQRLVYYALKGLLFGLRDPYSVALDPREFKHLHESMSGGNFGGIGIYIELDRHNHNQLMVVEPIEDTPAAHAGLKPGDYVLKINGASTRGIDLEVAANKIRGPIGSIVTLDVQRKGASAAEQFKIKRDLIHVKSATGKMLKGGIGWIRLRFFGEDTGQEVEEALHTLEAKGMKALILDVRNNGGGYITAAIAVCSKFLPENAVVVSVVGRKHDTEVDRATGGTHRHVPTVVLINPYSASASEITAGALQDTHKATLMGEKSFGKGTVQTLRELPDGGALKFTIAHYLTPAGRNINKKGIKPDIEVKMDASKVDQPGDVQLARAMSFLKSKL